MNHGYLNILHFRSMSIVMSSQIRMDGLYYQNSCAKREQVVLHVFQVWYFIVFLICRLETNYIQAIDRKTMGRVFIHNNFSGNSFVCWSHLVLCTFYVVIFRAHMNWLSYINICSICVILPHQSSFCKLCIHNLPHVLQ